MIYGKLIPMEQCEQIYNVRRDVVYEETGRMLDSVRDVKDIDAHYAIVLESMNSEDIVGCGRIYLDKNSAIIDKIAVLKYYRNKGYGDFILRMLINKALNSSADKIIVYGQKKYLSWYCKVGLDPEDHNEIIEDGGIAIIRMLLPKNELKKCCNL